MKSSQRFSGRWRIGLDIDGGHGQPDGGSALVEAHAARLAPSHDDVLRARGHGDAQAALVGLRWPRLPGDRELLHFGVGGHGQHEGLFPARAGGDVKDVFVSRSPGTVSSRIDCSVSVWPGTAAGCRKRRVSDSPGQGRNSGARMRLRAGA